MSSSGIASSAVDPIAVLEAAYGHHPSEHAWLEAVARALRPFLDPDRLSVHAYIAHGIAARRHDVVLPGRYPRERLREVLHAPSAYPPVARDIAHAMVEQFATARGINSLRSVAGAEVTRFWGHGVHDSIAFISPDGEGEAVVIAALVNRPFSLTPEDHALWTRVAVHVGAARRLRRGAPALDLEGEDVESILTPDGRMLEASGHAHHRGAREQLRDAVRTIDRCRTRRGRSDPAAALAAWAGLFSGRWTLVDHFDSDGQRFVVARRNDPDAPLPGALTRRQRQVGFYASLGWSNKEIGYALGLAPTTVSMHLGGALRRLGVRTRTQLASMAARVAIEAFTSVAAGADARAE